MTDKQINELIDLIQQAHKANKISRISLETIANGGSLRSSGGHITINKPHNDIKIEIDLKQYPQ